MQAHRFPFCPALLCTTTSCSSSSSSVHTSSSPSRYGAAAAAWMSVRKWRELYYCCKCVRILKGGSGRRLGGEEAEWKWLGVRTHGSLKIDLHLGFAHRQMIFGWGHQMFYGKWLGNHPFCPFSLKDLCARAFWASLSLQTLPLWKQT